MQRFKKSLIGSLPALLLATTATVVGGQETVLPGDLLAQQSLTASRLVYVAYAIVIVLIMVWAASIAKRLGEVEARLGD